MRNSHKSIGLFVHPQWILALGCGWLVSGLTPRFAVAEKPPRQWLPAAAEEKDPNLEILYALLDLICALLDCPTGGDPLAPTPMHMAVQQAAPPEAEAEMVDQIDAYNALGPLPSLTPRQRAKGRSDASTFLGFLQDNPYLVPDPLRNAYCGMLSGLINDL